MAEESINDDEKWVHDSSVDHKGRVPLRSATGEWKAAVFVVAIEFCERLTFFGIATNLITYFTKILHQELKVAVKNANTWSGVTTLIPLIGGFLADSYTGRYTMILISSIIYFLGLSLLTLSQFLPSLKPCKTAPCHKPRRVHVQVFFLAIYCLSLGTGGHKPCLESFGADQFDNHHPEESKKRMSYFNWWNFFLSCGLFLGVTVIVYVEDNAGWGVAGLILSSAMAAALVIFIAGRRRYRYLAPSGSPLTPMLQVMVAAARKRNLPSPPNPALLYESPAQNKENILGHTERMSFLDKAAIVEEETMGEKEHNPWRLMTVTRVEELKLVLAMIPIWLTSILFGVGVAQASTFFVKQAAIMDRRIHGSFLLPPASIHAVAALASIVVVASYEKILVPAFRKATGNKRGLSILQRIGVGLFFSIAGMGIAAPVERKRQGTAPLTMNVFWLAPQYLLLGIGDGFTLVGLQEYFYDQVPNSMRSLGMALYLSVIGAGSFLSNFIINVVDYITARTGRSWFGKDLNSSRLDKFYCLLGVLNFLNLCVYVFFARRYTYKSGGMVSGGGGGGGGGGALEVELEKGKVANH